ncbi:prepilin-type N-terminal cleavage/methylation domain-containing protein [Reinekea marinisedimentorum]|uniref:MSHA pilin protein MshA n=1 Tax=Reinekea marinisedimentorum TaxID=230495 RepID=A0A4R3IEL5_9GAMM|nr:prepilin-type N-terminal cleavage/methylation domain-containing protein [Reinekea marinisedimentorum]TCS44048.1 MSHA pilin protein MshA [Reinekea marinisedimentorum]
MKRAVRGFTLIELVIVFVVISILAAIAIARFADLRSNARTAVIEQVAGGMRSLSGLVHAQALVNGTDTSDSFEYAGETIHLRGGYIRGHWNSAWRYAMDVGQDISFTAVSAECVKNDLCGVGNQRPSAVGLSSVTSGNEQATVIIWLMGDTISDDCFAYYYNRGTGIEPSIGSITTGC